MEVRGKCTSFLPGGGHERSRTHGSPGDLRHEFHALNVGGDSPSSAFRLLLNTHNGGLTAHPTFLTLRDLGRKHQNDLKFAAFSNLRSGVEEYSALAEIACVARSLFPSGPGSYGDGNLHRDTFTTATLGRGTSHKEPEHTTRKAAASSTGRKILHGRTVQNGTACSKAAPHLPATICPFIEETASACSSVGR